MEAQVGFGFGGGIGGVVMIVVIICCCWKDVDSLCSSCVLTMDKLMDCCVVWVIIMMLMIGVDVS